jgi:hypothetical protein
MAQQRGVGSEKSSLQALATKANHRAFDFTERGCLSFEGDSRSVVIVVCVLMFVVKANMNVLSKKTAPRP